MRNVFVACIILLVDVQMWVDVWCNLLMSEWILLGSAVPRSVGGDDCVSAVCWQAALSWTNANHQRTKTLQHRR